MWPRASARSTASVWLTEDGLRIRFGGYSGISNCQLNIQSSLGLLSACHHGICRFRGGCRPHLNTTRATLLSIDISNTVQSSQTATLFPAPSVRHENGRTLVVLVQPARPFRRFTQATTSAAGMRVRRMCSCHATCPAFATQRFLKRHVGLRA